MLIGRAAAALSAQSFPTAELAAQRWRAAGAGSGHAERAKLALKRLAMFNNVMFNSSEITNG